MISPIDIDNAKRVRIADLLAHRGSYPCYQRGQELCYLSPLRTEKNPSFWVNQSSNVFKDMAINEHKGDVIRLVQLLDVVSFTQAVSILLLFDGQSYTPSFLLSGSSVSSETRSSTESIREIKLLQTPSLLRYVESRAIGISIARTYLHEVHYTQGERYRYALGFANDKQGYVLRNGVGTKRNIGPNDVTSLAGTQSGNGRANLFEGVFDFLSALEHYGQQAPTHDTFVLNSTSNLSRLLPRLAGYQRLNVYFDHDNAGAMALNSLRSQSFTISDCSTLYADYADFNEFLIDSRRSTGQNVSRRNTLPP